MFHEKELRRSPGTRLKEEPIPEIGDQLRLMVRHVQNPMGEMELSNTQRELEEREFGLWGEIKATRSRGGLIKGRVLNVCKGGWSVGIAGYVAFLPNNCVKPYDGRAKPPLGELLQFRILKIRDDIRNIVVEGPLSDGGGLDAESTPGGREATPREKMRKAWARRHEEEERIALGSHASPAADDLKDFWRRKGRGAAAAAATAATAADGERDGTPAVEKKETAPLEREAADGRPMWRGDKDKDEGAEEP